MKRADTQPAYSMLASILDIVPASRWTFARVGPKGELDGLYGSRGDAEGLSGLVDEFERQRTKFALGPRIAATLGPLGDFASGITLVFGDARSSFGILTLLRTMELGPFTSSEISMLTLALDAVTERLSTLRTQPPPRGRTAAAGRAAAGLSTIAGIVAGTDVSPGVPLELGALVENEGAFYVLDSDLQIVLAWSSDDQRRIALTGLHTRIAERLPLVLEETVRELTAAWSGTTVNQPGVAHPVPFLVVRTQPLSGPAGLFIGVRIDRFQAPNSLTGAASRFHISPREVQVLALLLDGNHLDQIAKLLYITSSTVQDHINSILHKTDSRNRSELIGRVLGWESNVSPAGE